MKATAGWKRRILFAVLSLFWMSVIFFFSARTGSVSNGDSSGFGMWLGHLLIRDFDLWSAEEQAALVAGWIFVIRKTAHALEYAALGFFFSGVWMNRQRKGIYNGIVPWAAGTFYAGTDEFHQLFVPGRSGQITDVILDSCGVFAGVLVMGLFFWWLKLREQKKKGIEV
ncbi:MAG: VanZ family protein [Clostridiales bacterium]|nr:VanZ family protein [Clostridiales bacterium]